VLNKHIRHSSSISDDVRHPGGFMTFLMWLVSFLSSRFGSSNCFGNICFPVVGNNLAFAPDVFFVFFPLSVCCQTYPNRVLCLLRPHSVQNQPCCANELLVLSRYKINHIQCLHSAEQPHEQPQQPICPTCPQNFST
jgi:hypothetical protein